MATNVAPRAYYLTPKFWVLLFGILLMVISFFAEPIPRLFDVGITVAWTSLLVP